MTSSGKNKSRYRAGKKRAASAAPAALPARTQRPPAVGVIQHGTPAPPGWPQGAYDALARVSSGVDPDAHAAMFNDLQSAAARVRLPKDDTIRRVVHILFGDHGARDAGSGDVMAAATMIEQMTLSEGALNDSSVAAADALIKSDSIANKANANSDFASTSITTRGGNPNVDNQDASDMADSDKNHHHSTLDSANQGGACKISSSSAAPSPTTRLAMQTTMYAPSDLILQPERQGMLSHGCTLNQARILVYFACFFICSVIRRRSKSVATPPNAFVMRLHALVLDRGTALLHANEPLAQYYTHNKSAMPSVIAHAAMLCAQEYMKAYFLDTLGAMRAVETAAQHQKASAADRVFVQRFVLEWLDANSTDEERDEYFHEMDGIMVDGRLFHLQVHFGKTKSWPRTIHGTRVMPFGVVDLLDKVKFGEGEKSRACLNCRAKYKTARAWREHLLTTTEHEVYLCCGRQFAELDLVLEHLVHQHKGGLGQLDPFIQRADPPMQMWDE